MKLGYWQEAVKVQQHTFVTVRLVDYGDLFWKDLMKFAHKEFAAGRVLTGLLPLPHLMNKTSLQSNIQYYII